MSSEMTFEHGYGDRKRIHRVVYIEYHGRNVHAVITDDKKEGETEFDGYRNDWDFELDCKECEKYMFYNSGSGGSIKEIRAAHWAPHAKDCSYWIHPDADLIGKVKNGVRKFKPFKYKGDPNPFNNGREIYGQDYCKFCNKWYDQDACPDHHIVNDQGELQYFDGSKID